MIQSNIFNVIFGFIIIIATGLAQRYDVILIPSPQSSNRYSHRQNEPKLYLVLNRQARIWNSPRKLIELDIEHYEEPTELPDIDNFDYEEKLSKHFRQSKSYRSEEFGDDKIVGGAEVDINLYPYHVSYGSNCGAAIIDRKWVITAAHCGKKPYVRVGSKYLNEGRKIFVRRHHIHPLWPGTEKEHPFDYDFQLLELEEMLKFDDSTQPVKIAHLEDMVIGTVVSVSGWGNTVENGPFSGVLRAVRVPIVSKEECQRVSFPYYRGSLTPRMFCAGFIEGKKDACQGDSGGPAVAHNRLLGMVSFGYGCATPGAYGVYSKVAKVRSWIEEITGLTLD